VESIEKYWPKQRVIVYDLGKVNRQNFEVKMLSKRSLENSTVLFQKWNNLEFRDFNFSRYPDYVRNLREFRWKPIIIAETLQEFSAVWYMDSSISFKKNDLNHVYELINCRKHVTNRSPLKSAAVRDQRESQITENEEQTGWDVDQWLENVAECRKMTYLLHGYTGHGIYPATSEGKFHLSHPEYPYLFNSFNIYKFIPTNFTEIKKPKAKMYEAGFVFAARTKDTVEKILKCSFRFDQSVVNLLAANAFYYDRHYYASEIVDFFSIER
ncbi:hypothetical protein Angca_002059, partial [Angiostrongylus cantonensis]